MTIGRLWNGRRLVLASRFLRSLSCLVSPRNIQSFRPSQPFLSILLFSHSMPACNDSRGFPFSFFPLGGLFDFWNAYGEYTVGSGKGTGYTKKGDTTAFRVGSVLFFFRFLSCLVSFLTVRALGGSRGGQGWECGQNRLLLSIPTIFFHKTDKARLRGPSNIPSSCFTSLGGLVLLDTVRCWGL